MIFQKQRIENKGQLSEINDCVTETEQQLRYTAN